MSKISLKSLEAKQLQCKGEIMAKSKNVMCSAKTKQGKRCKRPASGKSKFCSSHKKK
jgi:hypothetical protein